MSSAGLSFMEPPKQSSHFPFPRLFWLFDGRLTTVIVSSVSAVPAGEVIAREDVFGMVSQVGLL
jgi:hypothetical protein